MDWNNLPKPAEYAETQLINAILGGTFPIGALLPAERELATRLGVTRPTLREALQRLARDGWLEIHQGKPTRVRDYWREGSLGVLAALASRPWAAPEDFVPNLLAVRLALAPAYARQAVEQNPGAVVQLLDGAGLLPAENPRAKDGEAPSHLLDAFASFDWELHHRLTIIAANPIFTLIVNGFGDLYISLAKRYFRAAAARSASREFYAGLQSAALAADGVAAEAITRRVMQASLAYWQQANQIS